MFKRLSGVYFSLIFLILLSNTLLKANAFERTRNDPSFPNHSTKQYRHFRGGSSFLSIKGNDFHVLRSDGVNTSDMEISMLGISPRTMHQKTVAFAPISLPEGAQMKAMMARVLDRDPVANISVELVKTNWRYDQDFIRYHTHLFIHSMNAQSFKTLTDEFSQPVPFTSGDERWYVVLTFDGATQSPIKSKLRVSWVSIEYQ